MSPSFLASRAQSVRSSKNSSNWVLHDFPFMDSCCSGEKSCFWSCDRLYGPLRVFPLFFLVQMLNLWVCNFQPLNVINFYVPQRYDPLSICPVLFLLPRILYR